MPFLPIGPSELATEVADWIARRSAGRQRIGIDGFAESGATALADAIADQLGQAGRPVVRVSTAWWWRASALRLEPGRQDVESLLTGWVDVGALHREVLTPLAPDGTGEHLTRLRDPTTDRSTRQPRQQSAESAVLLLDGPFLLAHQLPWEAHIHLRVSTAAAKRAAIRPIAALST